MLCLLVMLLRLYVSLCGGASSWSNGCLSKSRIAHFNVFFVVIVVVVVTAVDAAAVVGIDSNCC